MGVKPQERRSRRSAYAGAPSTPTATASRLAVRFSRRRVVVLLAIVGVIGVLGAGVRGLELLSKVSRGGIGGVIGALTNQSELGTRLGHGDRINILLLGFGGGNHDGAYLTDSLMVLSLNPRTHQAAEISIPRDTEVKIHAFTDPSAYTMEKINAAYAVGMQPENWTQLGQLRPEYSAPTGGDRRDGAAKLAADVVANLTGLTIDHTVAMDFQGFREAVDAVGGVDITVDHSFTLDYPIGDTAAWTTIHFDPGPQHMDGKRVLEYVRSRYPGCSETGDYGRRNGVATCHGWPITDADVTDANDFARAQRQQQFLQAFRKRALSVNSIANSGQILSSLEKNLRTSLTLGDMRSLWDNGRLLEDRSVLHISLNNQNLLYDCTCDANGYTLHLYDDGGVLKKYLANLFQPAAVREAQAIQVLNGTSIDNLAAIWTDLLKQQGFKTVDPGAAGRAPTTEVADYSGGRAPATLAFLSTLLGATAVPETGSAPGAPLVLTIGHDFGLAFINQPADPAPVATTIRKPRPSPKPSPSPSPQEVPSPAPSPTRSSVIQITPPPITKSSPTPPPPSTPPSPGPTPSGQ